jgi:hypothetical protein
VPQVSPLRPGIPATDSYDGGIYAELVRNRTFQDRGKIGTVTVSLVEDEAGKAIGTVPSLTSDWQQHEFTLHCDAATKSS